MTYFLNFPQLLLGYFTFSGIPRLVAHAGRRSSGASGGSLHGGASFKVEKADSTA